MRRTRDRHPHRHGNPERSGLLPEAVERSRRLYVTEHRGITSTSVKRLAALLRAARVPSFSMQGSDEVKAGLLMSLAKADYSSVGMFHAQTIARIFNGEKPRSISQVWNAPPR